MAGDEPVPAARLRHPVRQGADSPGIHPARRLSAKIIGEIRSITTLTAAIAGGCGGRRLPVNCSFPVRGGERLDGADQHAFNEPVAVAEHVGSRQSVAAGWAVKEILLSLVSRPSLENRELQLVSWGIFS